MPFGRGIGLPMLTKIDTGLTPQLNGFFYQMPNLFQWFSCFLQYDQLY